VGDAAGEDATTALEMAMRLFPKTRSSRFFLVALIVMLVSAVATWSLRNHGISPTEWYFWTQGADAGIDIRSPNARAIIDADIFAPWSDDGRRSFGTRCNVSGLMERAQEKKVLTTGTEWRGVSLCNPAGLEGEEFDVAASYFRASSVWAR
jgi:hypothetical protein